MPADPREFPKTHDLAFLVDSLPVSAKIPLSLFDLPTLNRYAVQQRYPGAAPSVTRRDHIAAMRLAEETVAWAEKHLAHHND